LKKFLKIFPGDNLLSIVEGLVGVVGVCCGSSSFSTTAGGGIVTAVEEFLRAFAMAVEFAIAFFNVSDGEL
jgi:hypothetical protein